MRRLLTHGLDTALAPAALFWAGLVPALALATFVAAWGDGVGVPAWSTWSFYAQTRMVETVALLVMVPWVAVRALPRQSADDRRLLSAFTGARPSRLLLSRSAGALVAVWLTVLAATPIAILAQRMSGDAWTQVLFDDAVWLGLAAASVCLALWLEPKMASPVGTWWALVVALTLLLNGAARTTHHVGALVPVLAALGLLLLAMRRVDSETPPAIGDARD